MMTVATVATVATRWSLQNGRGIGVAIAFCLAMILRLHEDAQFNVLELLAILLPALEVAMFAAAFAAYLDRGDSVREVADAHSAEAAVAWFAVVFALIWGNIALMRMAIDAYVVLGVPPVWATGM